MPEDTVYVGRGADWGNPYRIGDPVSIYTPSVITEGTDYLYAPVITREIAVLLFQVWISDRLESQIRSELAGKDLACWCPLGEPCHVDVLLRIAAGGAA
jgi:hypothetical protein